MQITVVWTRGAELLQPHVFPTNLPRGEEEVGKHLLQQVREAIEEAEVNKLALQQLLKGNNRLFPDLQILCNEVCSSFGERKSNTSKAAL